MDCLAQSMSDAGHEVTVVTYDLTGCLNPSADFICENAPKYKVIKIRPGSRTLFYHEVRKTAPDVIHAHGIWEHVFPSFLAAKMAKVPFFITAHGTWQFLYSTPGFEKLKRRLIYKLYYQTVWRIMVMRSTGMIALNAIEIKAHHTLGAPNLWCIPNGVDCNEFHPGACFAEQMPRSLPDRYLLFAGSIQEQKGIFTLLAALKIIKDKGFPVPLIVAGEGPDLKKARLVASENTLDVCFLGRVERQQMPGLMAGASLFVLPSKNEPFATVFLEAMASGTPCVGTDSGGTPEIIDHGQNGFLIPKDDVNGLVQILLDFIEKPERFAGLGDQARKKMVSQFNWPVLTKRILAVYENRSLS